jgi:hypothetical protein
MSLTREQILNADDVRREKVTVPEWGGEVFVRTMTADERDEYEQERAEARGDDPKQNLKGVRAALVARTVCDEQGNALFTEEDVDALGKKSAKAMSRVFNKSAKLNLLTDSDIAELAGK